MIQHTHTPGPWRIASDGMIISGPENDPTMIADIRGFSRSAGKADARLIAAAPELLDALQNAVRCAQGGDVFLPAALVRARAAIVKATRSDIKQ